MKEQPSESVVSFQYTSRALRGAASPEAYALHKAALELSLADPIIIENSDDVKSRVSWEDRVKPFLHQMQNLMTFCRRLPVTLLADDVGLGKTISAGLILAELMSRRRVSRTLVLCPRILSDQWIEEMESKFGITGRVATGGSLEREMRSGAPLIVTTYESASPRLGKIATGMFDMLIMDEAHKVRNLYGTRNPPALASRLHSVLKNRQFKYVLMLTATPIHNRLWDIYSLVDCLAVAKGHVNPLGDEDAFRDKYIADNSSGARNLNKKHAEEFRQILRQYVVRTRREDVQLLFPKRVVRLWRMDPSEVDRRLQKIVADHIEHLNGFQQTSLACAMMSSPAALVSQLENMAKDKVNWKDVADEVRRVTERGGLPAKLRGLLQVIGECRDKRPADWRVVIFTVRKETLKTICEALTATQVRYGVIQGGAARDNVRTVEAFKTTPPAVNVIVSTDAGAEGVNLQAGNVVVNYDLPWNPMIVEQRIGRAQRLASEHDHVVVVNLAVKGSPEETVVVRLMEKLQTIAATVGDIEAILETTSGDKDEAKSFEGKIRELVVKSLLGRDVSRATALEEKSIENAKQLFEERREQIDQSLGRLDELHCAGPNMPRLQSVKPSKSAETFVREAVVCEGGEFVETSSCEFEIRRKSQPIELGTFDQRHWEQFEETALFHGRKPKLYQPGKPAFERLVQKWIDHAQHFVTDLREVAHQQIESQVDNWLQRVSGSRLVNVEVESTANMMQGQSLCKVTAGNGLDSYEKLVEVVHRPPDHRPVQADFLMRAEVEEMAVDPNEVIPKAGIESEESVRRDADVSAFCEFYLARLDEELGRTQGELNLKKRLTDDFQPHIHGETVALEAVQYCVIRCVADFTIDAKGPYQAALVLSPTTGQVLEEPEWGLCGETGREVPDECLDTCDISGSRVLRHLLVVSEESGRKALSRYSVQCEATGRIVLEDELLTSDVSGKHAAPSCFEMSPVSGRRGLLDEFVQCEVTGTRVLVDEVTISELSGRKYRSDEVARCAISGVTGHRLELVKCDVSGDYIVAEYAGQSDVSGRQVRQDLLFSSEKNPLRRGTKDELVTCELTGRRLLSDEVLQCAVSGASIDRDLLQTSEESGRLVSPSESVRCEVTGRLIAKDESVCSAVSGKTICASISRRSAVSGKCALAEEMSRCEVTGAEVLSDEVIASEVTGRMFRRDQVVLSDQSGRKGHRTESKRCEYTGRVLLADEVGRSEVTGKLTARADLVASEKSGRLARRDEMVRCAASGQLILSDEAGRSDVSGKMFDRDLLVRSAASHKVGHGAEMVRCQVSGRIVAPDETELCCWTGKRVERGMLLRSDLSSRMALPDQFMRCAASGKRGLPDELGTCEASGKLVSRQLLGRCEVTGKTVLREHLCRSSISGRSMLPENAIRSRRDGRICCPDEAKICAWSLRHFYPDEVDICRRTGLTFSRELLTDRQEFDVLDRLMRGQLQLSEAPDLGPFLRKRPGSVLQATKRVWCVSSPDSQTRVVCAEIIEMLGVRMRYAGFLVMGYGDTAQICGRITVQAKNDRGWDVLDESNRLTLGRLFGRK